jgi:hypothetical protein
MLTALDEVQSSFGSYEPFSSLLLKSNHHPAALSTQAKAG